MYVWEIKKKQNKANPEIKKELVRDLNKSFIFTMIFTIINISQLHCLTKIYL